MGNAIGIIAGAGTAGMNQVRAGQTRDAMAEEAARRFGALGTPESQQMAEFILKQPGPAVAFMEQFGGMGRIYGEMKGARDRQRFGSSLRAAAEGGYTAEERRDLGIQGMEAGVNVSSIRALTTGDVPDWIRSLSPNVHTAESIAAATAHVLGGGTEQEAAAMVKRLPPQPSAASQKPPAYEQARRLAEARANTMRKQGATEEEIQADAEYQLHMAQARKGVDEDDPRTLTQQATDDEIDLATDRMRERVDSGLTYNDAFNIDDTGALAFELYGKPKSPQVQADHRKAMEKKLDETDAQYRERTRFLYEWSTASLPKPPTPAVPTERAGPPAPEPPAPVRPPPNEDSIAAKKAEFYRRNPQLAPPGR